MASRSFDGKSVEHDRLKTPASLLLRLQQSSIEPRDWERFVSLYLPLMLHWEPMMEKQEAEAQCLVQDIFVRLIKVLRDGNYDPNKRFRGLLRTMARRCYINRHRRLSLPQSSDAHLKANAIPVNDEPFWEVEYRRF